MPAPRKRSEAIHRPLRRLTDGSWAPTKGARGMCGGGGGGGLEGCVNGSQRKIAKAFTGGGTLSWGARHGGYKPIGGRWGRTQPPGAEHNVISPRCMPGHRKSQGLGGPHSSLGIPQSHRIQLHQGPVHPQSSQMTPEPTSPGGSLRWGISRNAPSALGRPAPCEPDGALRGIKGRAGLRLKQGRYLPNWDCQLRSNRLLPTPTAAATVL